MFKDIFSRLHLPCRMQQQRHDAACQATVQHAAKQQQLDNVIHKANTQEPKRVRLPCRISPCLLRARQWVAHLLKHACPSAPYEDCRKHNRGKEAEVCKVSPGLLSGEKGVCCVTLIGVPTH